MNDREMLELAAKAAGIAVEYRPGSTRNRNNSLKKFDVVTWDGPYLDRTEDRWNPLTDDGDALRLAVKLDIEIYQADDDGPCVYAGYWGKPERRDVTRIFAIEPLESDPCAATRRAIVRAAAAIGKAM